MITLFFLIVGSVLIGFGTNSWLIGSGVAIITCGFHIHFSMLTHNLHAALTRNMVQIYNKIS